MKKNNYWKKYQLEYQKKWSFNPFSKRMDYQYIGRVKTNFKEIDYLVSKLETIQKID